MNADEKVVKDAETVDGIVMVVNNQQPLKVLAKVVQAFILVGIVTEVRDSQVLKQLAAVVTKFIVDGKVTIVSGKQFWNVADNEVTAVMLVGIVIDSNLLHPKHIDAIEVILF
jgi:hypothetical protein